MKQTSAFKKNNDTLESTDSQSIYCYQLELQERYRLLKEAMIEARSYDAIEKKVLKDRHDLLNAIQDLSMSIPLWGTRSSRLFEQRGNELLETMQQSLCHR